MLHFLRTALLAALFCLATSAFSQREAVIGIAPDYSSYATLISQQDTSLVFVTDQRDTISLTILKNPWKMMSRIGNIASWRSLCHCCSSRCAARCSFFLFEYHTVTAALDIAYEWEYIRFFTWRKVTRKFFGSPKKLLYR